MLAEIFGPDLLVVVLVVVVLIFGGAAIPKLARNLGAAQGEFKKGLADAKDAGTTGDAKATDVPSNGVRPEGTKSAADAQSEGNNAG